MDDDSMMGDDDSMMDDGSMMGDDDHDEIEDWYVHMMEHMHDDDHEDVEDWYAHMVEEHNDDEFMMDDDSMMGDDDHDEIEVWEEPTGKVKEVSITASYWRFEPASILVSENDTVRLTISSVNNMMPMMARMFPNHGIAIEDYGLNYTLPVGETVTIEFVATKNGEIHFHCSIYCGVGHEDMHGELIVNGVDSPHMEPSNGTTVAGPRIGTLT